MLQVKRFAVISIRVASCPEKHLISFIIHSATALNGNDKRRKRMKEVYHVDVVKWAKRRSVPSGSVEAL